MLIIKNAELISSNISFTLPKDFYLDFCNDSQLKLVSFDGLIEILIRFEFNKLTSEQAFDNFFYNADAIQIGDYFKIKRGNGTALAVYCEFEDKQTYMECYKFEVNVYGENTISFSIVTLENDIYSVLEMPQIKCFFKSLKYF